MGWREGVGMYSTIMLGESHLSSSFEFLLYFVIVGNSTIYLHFTLVIFFSLTRPRKYGKSNEDLTSTTIALLQLVYFIFFLDGLLQVDIPMSRNLPIIQWDFIFLCGNYHLYWYVFWQLTVLTITSIGMSFDNQRTKTHSTNSKGHFHRPSHFFPTNLNLDLSDFELRSQVCFIHYLDPSI